jgi:hypothetical protein
MAHDRATFIDPTRLGFTLLMELVMILLLGRFALLPRCAAPPAQDILKNQSGPVCLG